jgi:GNAT superfamily N-acetyltransferase
MQINRTNLPVDADPRDVILKKMVWFVAYEKDIINWAAYAGIQVRPKEYYFGPVYVKPEYRGQGLQLRLLRIREEYARERGVHRLTSCAYSSNPYSINNLLKAGFNEIYRIQVKGYDEIYYGKDIINV